MEKRLREERAIDLATASRRHKMVKDAVAAAEKAGIGRKTTERSKIETTAALDTIWKTLVGSPMGEFEVEVLSSSIVVTMPKEAITILRRADSVPAAFAFAEIAKVLADQIENLRLDRSLSDDLAVRDAIRYAWERWDIRRRQANEIEEGFGCDQSQSWHTLRDVVEKNDSNLTELLLRIARLAGRMFEAMAYSKRTVKSDDPHEVKSAGVGGDISRLLPAELAKLGNGSTRDLTVMKIVKKEAAVFEMAGERPKARGPMVVALDESGSMHDHGPDGRNTWSKAAAVALTRIAWSEGRPVRVVHFGTATVTQDVPKDDLDAMWDMARSFLSGGTSFETALSASREEVGDLDKAGYKGADIVLITDGEDSDYTAHDVEIEKMDKDGVKLWTVSIGNAIAEKAPVRARAEKYVHARDVDLSNPKTAALLAAQLKDAALADPKNLN